MLDGRIHLSGRDTHEAGGEFREQSFEPELLSKLSFDVTRDLAPVCLLADSPFVLVVHPSVAASSVKDLIALAKAHPETVRAIIVGNEVLLRGEQTGETLAGMAKRIKAETGLPVTYADVWEFWLRAPEALKQSVDFITIHVLPYWEDDPLPVSEAVKHLETIVAEVQEKFPGREIVIGETGWPSAGRWRPSPRRPRSG